MRLVYVAHPVRPRDGETLAGNLARARRWLRWLLAQSPSTAYIAPWITECELCGDEITEEEHLAGLARDVAVVKRCDGIVLVGGRISGGMRMEMDAARAAGRDVHDLTALGSEPPK